MHSPQFALGFLALMFGSELLAQVSGLDAGWLTPVVNAGGFGVVCWVLRWFMTDVKRELVAHRGSMERLTKSLDDTNIAHFTAAMLHKSATEEMRGEMERRIAEIKERSKAPSA